jgi:hypothetical protein
MTSGVEIRDDGKGKHQSFSARWTLDVLGGMGLRNVNLEGWGANEIESREQLITQARAARDNLNSAIEAMIGQLIEKKGQ